MAEDGYDAFYRIFRIIVRYKLTRVCGYNFCVRCRRPRCREGRALKYLLLHYHNGWTMQRIGDDDGVSKQYVQQVLLKALKKK